MGTVQEEPSPIFQDVFLSAALKGVRQGSLCVRSNRSGTAQLASCFFSEKTGRRRFLSRKLMLCKPFRKRTLSLKRDPEFRQDGFKGIRVFLLIQKLHEAEKNPVSQSGYFEQQMAFHDERKGIHIVRDFAPVHPACIVGNKGPVLSVFPFEGIMLFEICQLLLLTMDRFQLFKKAEFFPQLRKDMLLCGTRR